jgi:hypothetical protein
MCGHDLKKVCQNCELEWDTHFSECSRCGNDKFIEYIEECVVCENKIAHDMVHCPMCHRNHAPSEANNHVCKADPFAIQRWLHNDALSLLIDRKNNDIWECKVCERGWECDIYTHCVLCHRGVYNQKPHICEADSRTRVESAEKALTLIKELHMDVDRTTKENALTFWSSVKSSEKTAVLSTATKSK